MSSIIDPSTGSIVKSDRIGRTRYTRQYKQQVLAAFESSRLSAPLFAAHCGIKYPTFAAWTTAAKRSTPNRVGDSAYHRNQTYGKNATGALLSAYNLSKDFELEKRAMSVAEKLKTESRMEGISQGREVGLWIGEIQILEEFLGKPQSLSADSESLGVTELGD